MPHPPTGAPRGRRVGSGALGLEGDGHTRLPVRIPAQLYARLEAYSVGRAYRHGTPQLARAVRELLEHALACPQQRPAQPQEGHATPETTAPSPSQKSPRRRKRQAAPAA